MIPRTRINIHVGIPIGAARLNGKLSVMVSYTRICLVRSAMPQSKAAVFLLKFYIERSDRILGAVLNCHDLRRVRRSVGI